MASVAAHILSPVADAKCSLMENGWSDATMIIVSLECVVWEMSRMESALTALVNE